MPQLGNKKIQKFYLPSTAAEAVEADKAWVEINMTINVEDIKDVQQYDDQLDQTAYVVSRLITSWNLTNPGTEVVADITPENVRKLPLADFQFLGSKIQGEVETQTKSLDNGLKEI